MISVVICSDDCPGEWEIDTKRMNCRVLGRRVENMVLMRVCENARRRGIYKLESTYIETDRNRLVEDHYPKLGFVLFGGNTSRSAFYELDVGTASFQEVPIAVASDFS